MRLEIQSHCAIDCHNWYASRGTPKVTVENTPWMWQAGVGGGEGTHRHQIMLETAGRHAWPCQNQESRGGDGGGAEYIPGLTDAHFTVLHVKRGVLLCTAFESQIVLLVRNSLFSRVLHLFTGQVGRTGLHELCTFFSALLRSEGRRESIPAATVAGGKEKELD